MRIYFFVFDERLVDSESREVAMPVRRGRQAAKGIQLCVSASLRDNKKNPSKSFLKGYFVGPLGIEPSTYCPEGSGESLLSS